MGTALPPSASPPKRTLRGRVLRFLLLLIAVGSASGFWLGKWALCDERICDIVRSRIQEHFRGRIVIREAHLGFDGNLEVRGLTVLSADERPDEPIPFEAESIHVQIDLWELACGRDPVRAVECNRASVNWVEDHDGHSNFENLLRPQTEQPDHPADLQTRLHIKGIRIQRWVRVNGVLQPQGRSPEIDFEVRPETARAGFQRFRAWASEVPGKPEVAGSIRLKPLRIEATAVRVEMCPELEAALPPEFRVVWNRYSPQGRFTNFHVVYDAAQNLLTCKAEFDRIGLWLPVHQLRSGPPSPTLAKRDPERPAPDYALIDEVSGSVEFGPSRLALHSCSGRFNGMDFSFDAEFTDWEKSVPGIRIEGRLPKLDLRRSLWAYQDLSPDIQEQVRELSPLGTADIRFTAQRRSGESLDLVPFALAGAALRNFSGLPFPELPHQKLEPPLSVNGRVDLTDGTLLAADFPYLLDNVNGTVLFDNNVANIDLHASHGQSKVHVAGAIYRSAAKFAGLDWVIRTENSALDADLQNAIPERFRKFYTIWNLRGGVPDSTTWVYREAGDVPNMSIFTSVRATGGASYSFDGLPLRVNRCDGYVEIWGSGRAGKLIDGGGRVFRLAGDSGGGRVSLDAAGGVDEGGRIAFWADYRTTDLPLDRDLSNALPTRYRAWFDSLNLSGRTDIVARVWQSAADTDVRFDVNAHSKRASMSYEKFKYDITDAEAFVRITPDAITIDRFNGRHGPARLDISGVVGTSGERHMDLTIDAKALPLDAALHSQLGAAARRYWDRLRPEGSLDVKTHLVGAFESVDGVRTDMDLTAHGIRMRPIDFPYTFDDVRGTVISRPGVIRWDNIKAKHGDTDWTIGGDCRMKEKVAHRALQIAGERVTLDKELLDALPDKLRAGLLDLKTDGKFRLDLNLVSSGTEERASAWQYDGRMKMDRATLKIGKMVDELDAVLVGQGEYFPVGGRWQAAMELRAKSGRFNNVPFTDVVARFDKPVDTDRFTVSEFSGKACKGDFSGTAWVSLAEDGRYSVRMGAQNMEFSEFWSGMSGKPSAIAGRFGTAVGINGSHRSTKGFEMAGEIICRNGKLGGLAAGKPVSPDTAFAFETGSMRYRRRDDEWFFENVLLEGSGLRLAGRGKISAKDDIDMTFVLAPPRQGDRIPVFGELLRGVTNELMQVHVSGPSSDPHVERRNLDQFGKPLRDLLGAKKATK